ncbi:hypothetical protein AR687_07920 [Flavobacteriaceae bacterium CRH]|nr:hypothetical protein AR687_07920 [Flavobacteriaceae bacterium CRH]
MKEYKIAKGWAIFIYITAPLLIALFVWILLMPIIPGMKNDLDDSYYWFLALISIAMIALMVIGILDTIKGKFIIDKNKIYTTGVFSTRALFFHEIKGYRIADKFIFIEPIKKDKKVIKVSSYFAKTDEIKEWLIDNYSDLDLTKTIAEKKAIINNTTFGLTKKEREEKLKQAFKVSTIFNWTGGLIGLWVSFFPKPYEFAIIGAVLFPILSIAVLKYFNGLIKFDEYDRTAYPSLFWAIFAPSIAIFLRSIIDFNIFDYSKVWPPTILLSLSCMAVILYRNQEFKDTTLPYVSYLSILLFMSAYAYGAVVTLNCAFDNSQPKLFNAKILNKNIHSGKSETYHFELTPWGSQKEPDEVTVSKDLYNSLEKNDAVTIYFMKGKFEIAWFEISE